MNAPYTEWADVVRVQTPVRVVVDESQIKRLDLNEKDVEMKSRRNLVFVRDSKRHPQRFNVPSRPIRPDKPKKSKSKKGRHPYAKKGERM